MLEHSQEERSSNMRKWGAGCLQTGKSGSERGCRVIPTRDIRSPLYRFKNGDRYHSFTYPQAGYRKIHRRKKGSRRRHRAKKELSRVYRKVRNRRRDFLHKESRQLVNKSGTLVFEDLLIKNMTKRPQPKQDEETGQYRALGA